MILHSTVEVIDTELRAQLGDHIQSLDIELQEDANRLLVMIVPSETAEAQKYQDILDVAKQIIAPKIPPIQDDHSWMVVIMTPDRRQVIRTVHATIL